MGKQQNSKSLNALTNIFYGLALCAGALIISNSSAQAQNNWPQKGAVKNGTIAQQGTVPGRSALSPLYRKPFHWRGKRPTHQQDYSRIDASWCIPRKIKALPQEDPQDHHLPQRPWPCRATNHCQL